MPPKPTLIPIAGTARRAAARGHDAGQRRHPDAQLREVRELSDLADQLQALMSGALPSTANSDRKIAMIEELADRWDALRDSYRGPSARPVHPPRYVSPDGRSAAW